MPTSSAVDSPLMRGHNEGSMTRRKDGRLMIQVTMPDGSRRTAYAPRGTPKRSDAAKAILNRLLTERDEHAELTGDSDLGKFLRQWLDDVTPSLRPATRRHYELTVTSHLTPALGHHKLARLSASSVQAYLADKGKTLSPQTVRHHRAVLRRALNTALRWGLVTRNVATLVEPPRVPRREMQVLELDQARKLLQQVEGDRLHALWVLAITTGMRQAEILGLTWLDIDLRAGTLHIQRTLTRVAGSFEMAETKTSGSRRTISLPAMTVAALRSHKVRQKAERLAQGLTKEYTGVVFTTRTGYPIYGSTLLDELHSHLAAAELPKIRFHDLRHSAATLLLAQGATLEDVKQLLGHSTITLTSNTYSHFVRERSRQVADTMGKALEGAG